MMQSIRDDWRFFENGGCRIMTIQGFSASKHIISEILEILVSQWIYPLVNIHSLLLKMAHRNS